VPKRQSEESTAKVTKDLDDFYQHRASQGPKETLDPSLMSDIATGSSCGKEDLREGTKRAAERESRKLRTRLLQGEKRNRVV
jgi:hypothetical protein